MRKTIYLLTLLVSVLAFSSCMDGDWDEPSGTGHGNDTISESNVISIAQLKQRYSSYIGTDYRDGISYTQVTEPLQIKGIVTGNDIEGNIYSEIALQDSTGAIIVAISEGGICGYLPVGTEILINLQGLYVGNYGMQAEIGTPYTNSRGNTYISRMSRILWNSHFKYTGRTRTVEPEEFSTSWNLNSDGGKLGILRDVQFDVSNDTTTYANPGAGSGSKSIYFKTQRGKTNRNVMVYTSNYADFAADYVPTGRVNVTGIVKRYNNSWEFIIRSISDVEEIQ